MLLGGGFGGEQIAGVEEAQYVLVLVVAVRPQEREQAVPALTQFSYLYTSVGATAGRVLRARPAAATAVTRCSGAAMIAIGALLLAEHLLT